MAGRAGWHFGTHWRALALILTLALDTDTGHWALGTGAGHWHTGKLTLAGGKQCTMYSVQYVPGLTIDRRSPRRCLPGIQDVPDGRGGEAGAGPGVRIRARAGAEVGRDVTRGARASVRTGYKYVHCYLHVP